MNLRIGVAVAALAMAAATPAVAAGSARHALTTIKALNLIVLGDANLNDDVEGKAYIGGNLSGSAPVGIGNSANGQFAVDTGFHSTLAVGGNSTAQINLNYGTGAGNHYGAYIVGSAGQLTVNASGGTIRVGSLPSQLNLPSSSFLYVAGNAQGDISTGTSEFIQIGGTASGKLDVTTGSTVSAGGYTGGNKLDIASGAQAIIGGNIGAAQINGGGATLQVIGSISEVQSYASNSLVKAGGSIGGQGNGTGNSNVSIYARGTIAIDQNLVQNNNPNLVNIHPLYKYAGDAGALPGAVAAPAAPATVTVGSLASYTAQLTADVLALSTALGGMATTNAVSFANNNTELTFSFAGAPATAVFDLTASQFNTATQFAYNFGSADTPVIINIHGTSLDWNATASGGNLPSINQQIIYNFLDATSLNVNRAVWGSVLAPSATVRGNTMNGSVVAKIFNQSGEVHLGTYARNINFLPADGMSPTPEPAVWVQLIAGFGLAGALMRRRRRAVTA